jgi:hypothetical protein
VLRPTPTVPPATFRQLAWEQRRYAELAKNRVALRQPIEAATHAVTSLHRRITRLKQRSPSGNPNFMLAKRAVAGIHICSTSTQETLADASF